ncbi:SusC/RagA family TonB-linked outer membrane protein [Cyclobacterium qasimii]|uniref:TonB-dependent receptor n=2 Tax=Cyclobacterium qasimii TaxID=1350429 RepID=S7WZT6_9BACT|nr:TonB-dependent receptor [Cyclobacterium qasimii]EPR69433.1 TonB-dependent receptor [Cyclobacterium qasimii M12-11B]GEO22090.1 SusC/RagA family TonB-linked outer membrane protein [Cyclobacterium qasimii]
MIEKLYTKWWQSVFIVLLLITFSTEKTWAQSQNVTGTVYSEEDGSTIPGVNIIHVGTATGTVTDMDGKFTISLSGNNTVLKFSAIGFKPQEISIGNQTNIDVTLETALGALDEIIVVGYGEQSREKLTSAVSTLDTKVLENVPLGNAASALQGTVSGVRVQTLSGQPGAAPRIIVRGGTSINDPNGAEPLYVVDGVIRDDIQGINPMDIESMQVLKDAASTAIYGSRASNGVVILTTKTGKAGDTKVTYRYTIGTSQLREKYDLLSARDYIYYSRLGIAATGIKSPTRLAQLDGAFGYGIGNDLTNNTAYTTQYLTPENEYKLSEGWQSMPDPVDPTKTIIFDEVDWQDQLFRTAVTQDHYLNLSGGTEKATFNIGVGYSDMDGIAITTNYKRFTANMNGRLKVSDKLFVFAGLNFTRSSDNLVYSENSLFERSIATPPTAKYAFEDGTLAPGVGRSLGNPAYQLSRSVNDNTLSLMTLSGGANWELAPGLSFEPSASLYTKANTANTFLMSYLNSPTQLVEDRIATGSQTNWEQLQLDAVLNYEKSFAQLHNFTATLGYSMYQRDNYSLFAQGRGAATDLIPTLNASGEAVQVSSSKGKQLILGYFGRANYDFDNKYLFSMSARYDGASNLGSEYKWGFFPGVSAGWNLHNESFWDSPAAIDKFKLRASYGLNGNLGNLADFQAQGAYSVGGIYQGNAAVEYTTIANPNLKWEQSRTFDVGFDAGLFNNRLTVLFDYYQRVTSNLITTLAMPKLTGFTSILTNLGSLENSGVELEVNFNVLSTKDWMWDIGFNTSFVKNKILELPENDNENNRIGGLFLYDEEIGDYAWKGGLQEGGQIGEMYGYQYLSVFPTDEAAAAAPQDLIMAGPDRTRYGGDVDWQDVDGNNVIDTRDRVYMGNIFPKWTGGFSNNVNYKGVNLYLRMDYTTGHTIYNYVRANLDGEFVGNTNMSSNIARSWENQGDVTDVPKFYWADQVAQSNYWRGDPRNLDNGGGSSVNYEKGDFLALRELTISYDYTAGWYKKIGIEGIRLNLTGNNLVYFTSFSGLSPEDGGINRGRFPVPRNIMLGINLSL